MRQSFDQHWSRFRDQRRKDSRKTYDAKALWQHHHEIINLHVQGLKGTQIAEIVGVTTATVSNTLNSTLGCKKAAVLRAARDCDSLDAARKIMKMGERAVDIVSEFLEKDEDEQFPNFANKRLNIAMSVIKDISGLAAPKRIEGRFTHAMFSADQIEEIKRKGREAAREVGLLVE